MTSQTRRTLEAVAIAIGLMLCASVSYAQGPPVTFPQPPESQTALGQARLAENAYPASIIYLDQQRTGMYVACWAEVPSHNTAYFSATFAAPAVYGARKQFRELVTAQYGTVSKVQCAGKFSGPVVKDIVQEWKDKVRATNNAIVETDWAASTAVVPSTLSRSSCYRSVSPFAQSGCSARIPEQSPP